MSGHWKDSIADRYMEIVSGRSADRISRSRCEARIRWLRGERIRSLQGKHVRHCKDSRSERCKERRARSLEGQHSRSRCKASCTEACEEGLAEGCEDKELPTATVKACLMAPSRAQPITVRTAYPIAARKRHAGLCKDSITHRAASETILVHAKKVWPMATEKAWLLRRRTGVLRAGSI